MNALNIAAKLLAYDEFKMDKERALTIAEDIMSLFPYPYNPAKGKTETSALAAEKIKIGELHREVLRSLMDYGPMATHQIADRTGIKYKTAQPRTSELKLLGMIIESKELTAYNEDGNKVAVWELVK